MNEPAANPRLINLRRVLLVFVGAWFATVVIASIQMANRLQRESPPSLPFGVFVVNGATYTEDFSYNLLYLRGIHDRLVAHPYRLADQEKMIREILPTSTSGMSHAYSPVAFVLALPLLDLSGRSAYAVYSAACALATTLLFGLYLFPRAREPAQLCALALSAMSVWVVTTFTVGQTSPITTAAMGAFWALLGSRGKNATLLRDAEIAALFWTLCLKPSVAILPIVLLVGLRAWRSLLLGVLMLTLTWAGVCGYYGGFWTGLGDYWHLLNHYNNAWFPEFMQRGAETGAHRQFTAWSFALERDLILLISLALIALRWVGRIGDSTFFQAMVWVFLLLSPYLMPTENWILWLLVVEGTFFLARGTFAGYLKLAILVAIFHLRAHVTFPLTVDMHLKFALAAWWLAETWLRSRGEEEPEAKAFSS